MDAFADKARAVADEVIAIVRTGQDKGMRERLVERLENAMRQANAQWQRDQALAPPKHDPFTETSDAA